MRKYKARVIHNVEILLGDESGLNDNEWLEIIATTLAYYKNSPHGKYVSQEIEIEEIKE